MSAKSPTSAPPEMNASAPATALPLFLYGGVASAWECDHLGHFNTRYYFHRAQQGWAIFAAAIKLPNAFTRDAVSTLLPRDMHVRFHREILAGEHLVMRGGVVEVQDESVVLYQELRKTSFEGEIAATFRVVLDHVEAKTAKRFGWAQKAREAMKTFLIDAIPDYAAPRSVDLSGTADSASLRRAEEMGVPPTVISYLQDHECDVWGRARPESIMARQADGSHGMYSSFYPESREIMDKNGMGPRLSAALLECRLVFRNWPRTGNLAQVHSGLVAVTPKTNHVVMWMLDPISGECWASGEYMSVNFNTETRSSFVAPDEYLAFARSKIVKGLTL